MAYHIQVEGGRTAQIGLEGQSFLLPATAAHQPLYGKSAGLELNRHARVFEPAGREVQARLQAGTTHPVRLQNATFTGACRLHPAHGEGPSHVNKQKASHNASSDAHGTSEVADEARGHSSRRCL